jgi:hypothetical protein
VKQSSSALLHAQRQWAEGIVTFEDANASPHPMRFYRVVAQ